MIIYIEASKPVIKALVDFDMSNSCDDIMSVNGRVVKIQGELAKTINSFFGGCAYEISSVKQVKNILKAA
jgi:hypothetical protein